MGTGCFQHAGVKGVTDLIIIVIIIIIILKCEVNQPAKLTVCTLKCAQWFSPATVVQISAHFHEP